MTSPLQGVRVLAIEQFGAGPFGTLHLADLGAEVIKIENPHNGGDVARTVPPFTCPGDSLYFQSLNRNKLSVSLDLKSPEGQLVFHDLVQGSDAVFCNLRGDLPEALGLTYDHLKTVNPRIVCCSLTGFGLTGPRRSEPAYDYLIQGLAGWMSLTGDPSSLPAKSGLSIVDFSAGVAAMLGLMVGLFNAQRTGIGCDVDVSLLDTAVSMLNYVAIWTLNRDYQPERLAASAHPTLVPAQVFRTKDSYLVVLCFKEKFWDAMVEVLDAPGLMADPRFATFADRYKHRETLIDDLKPRFLQHTTSEWLERMAGRVPCSPVNTVEEALRDEQVLERSMVIEADHPSFGRLKQVATAVKIDRSGPSAVPAPGPHLGQSNREVLETLLGYNDERIASLRRSGVI